MRCLDVDELPIEDRLALIRKARESQRVSYMELARNVRPFNLTIDQWMRVVVEHLKRKDKEESDD